MESNWKVEDVNHIREILDSIEQAVVQLRKMIICRQSIGCGKNQQKSWVGLTALSDEISEQWKGFSAIEEIRLQREK